MLCLVSRLVAPINVAVAVGVAVGWPISARATDFPSQKRYKTELKALSERFSLQYNKNQLAEAEQTAQNAVELAERGFGPESPYLASALNNLTLVQQARGTRDDIEPMLQRILAIREKALGPEHPDTAKALSNLGRQYHFHGNRDKAEPLYRRALAIREKAFGPKDLSVASSLHDLMMWYKDQERYEEALPLMEREVMIWDQVMGENHPTVAIVLSSYIELLRKVGHSKQADAVENRLERLRRLQEEKAEAAASSFE